MRVFRVRIVDSTSYLIFDSFQKSQTFVSYSDIAGIIRQLSKSLP